jgi:hypothetical protein
VRLSDNRNDIAQMPTPLASTSHLVTASEVATVRFLRNRLGLTQVPRIISWSSRALATPVGAECTLMDVANGVELSTLWRNLSMKQNLKVVCE